MADNKVRIPTSQGGLVQYHDEYKSKFMLKPMVVIFLIIIVIALEIMLHAGFFS